MSSDQELILKQTEEIKTLKGQLVEAEGKFHKALEKNNDTFKSFEEKLSKLGEEKVASRAKEDEEAKKQLKIMEGLEDKIKTLEAREKANYHYGTPEGLAKKFFGDREVGDRELHFAKSIVEDPFSEDYKQEFFKMCRGKGHGGGLEALVEKIKSDGGYTNEDSFIKKSLNTIVGTDGAYFVPPELDLAVQKILFETSPIRQVATVRMTAGQLYQFNIRTKIPEATWQDSETYTQEETSTQKYVRGEIAVQELVAQPEISLVNLEDSALDIEMELKEGLAEAYMLAENKAFVQDGDGVKKPKSLNYYATKAGDTFDIDKPLKLQKRQVAVANFNADTLLNLESDLFSPYKGKAVWLMNRPTKNVIRQLKDSNNQYLFSTTTGWGGARGVQKIRDGRNGTLFGYPVIECDDLPSVSAAGYPIYFGDFSKYVILERLGLTTIVDNLTKKGWVKFYTRKRIGGGLKFAQGIKVLQTT